MAEEYKGNDMDRDDNEQEDDEDDSPIIQIKVQNIVATINLGCKLDLNKITQTARNSVSVVCMYDNLVFM